MKINKDLFFVILLLIVVLIPFITLADSSVSAEEMVGSIKTALVTIGGTMVIIGWVIAGILYLSSAGSQERAGMAKKALVAAIIGTVVLLMAGIAEELLKSLLSLP